MQTVVIQTDRATAASDAAVTAAGITRRYGAGETAVDALRGVSIDVASGQPTAVMGPSGPGNSTLMHILAGLDRASSSKVAIAGGHPRQEPEHTRAGGPRGPRSHVREWLRPVPAAGDSLIGAALGLPLGLLLPALATQGLSESASARLSPPRSCSSSPSSLCSHGCSPPSCPPRAPHGSTS